jgi:hypothetical protein
VVDEAFDDAVVVLLAVAAAVALGGSVALEALYSAVV